MLILGIHDGHNATACLLNNGKILGMASEERFTKVKNQGGFPIKAIQWLLDENDISQNKITNIAFAGKINPVTEVTSNKRLRHNFISKISQYLPSSLIKSSLLNKYAISRLEKKRKKLDYYEAEFKELGIDKNKITFIEHHTCHGSTAYYSDDNYDYERKVLVFTLDGSGDGVSATVSIGHKNTMRRLKTIHSYDSLGMVYSRTTAFLGMKPLEHEYKLMGMAPYASDYQTKISYDTYKKYISLSEDGLSIENKTGRYGNGMLEKMKEDLFLQRFDGVSAGLQKITEEIASNWIYNWVEETGIKNIVVAGGVFMNVKLNMILNESDNIDNVFFMPSCGDESICLGAALETYVKNNKKQCNINKLKNIYLGPSYDDNQIKNILESRNEFNFKKYEDINSHIADMLTEDKIIGRLYGKMEFGARSLGNRSIIANPSNYQIVSKINRAIKMRDFWMPFAPSIIAEDATKYLVSNKQKFTAPFMILGFNTTELAQTELAAGLHQSDFTCRPQLVEKNANPEYYDLIEKFKNKTGISGVLNTSFNIHGYPIVNGPEDALWTLQNSDLDAIQIGNYLVTKK